MFVESRNRFIVEHLPIDAVAPHVAALVVVDEPEAFVSHRFAAARVVA